MLELLSAIIETADNSFLEAEGLSLFPGEYMDGSPADPDITEIEIEIDPLYADHCKPDCDCPMCDVMRGQA